MRLIQKTIEENLQENYQHLKPLDVEIFNFLNKDSNRYKNDNVIDAVVLFNWALLHLDKEPDEDNREVHVLLGDYLLSQFYRLAAKDNNMGLLSDMMNISKDLHSDKSTWESRMNHISSESFKHTLFQPLLYLIEHGYVSQELNDVLTRVVERNMSADKNLNFKDVL